MTSTRKALRRWVRARVGTAFARRGVVAEAEPIDPRTVSRIAVIRVNARLGNTLFLTPLLTALHAAFPAAEMDLLTSYRRAGRLLAGFPGLARVLIVPDRPLQDPRRFAQVYRSFRSVRYDLALDPALHSTNDRIALALCRSRWKAGFSVADQWLKLTHPCEPSNELHEATKPLALLGPIADRLPDVSTAQLHLQLTRAELRLAADRIDGAVSASRSCDTTGPRLGFFASARGRKDLGHEWWRGFLAGLHRSEPRLVPIEFLPWGSSRVVDERFPRLSCDDPREMAAAIAATDIFVSADTGPMHIASATAVPTVGLFTVTDPRFYRPLKTQDIVLVPDVDSPGETAVRVLEQLRRTQSAKGCV